jgi:carboxymethylenebutenolidase
MLHFGGDDSHIGEDQIDAVSSAHQEVEIYVYKGAGHAFNRDVDATKYHAASAKLARERTLDFLKRNVA